MVPEEAGAGMSGGMSASTGRARTATRRRPAGAVQAGDRVRGPDDLVFGSVGGPGGWVSVSGPGSGTGVWSLKQGWPLMEQFWGWRSGDPAGSTRKPTSTDAPTARGWEERIT